MTMDKTVVELFKKRTGLTLRSMSPDESERAWRGKGEVYRHALLKIREQDPLAVAPVMVEESFPKAVLKFFEGQTDAFILKDAESEEEKKSLRRDFDLRPDLFAIDIDECELRLHEIEDTHPLEPAKLRKIMEAYGWCDEEGVGLRLFVYDRYGMSMRELDIPFLVFTDYGQDMFVCSMPGVREGMNAFLGTQSPPDEDGMIVKDGAKTEAKIEKTKGERQ